MYSRHVEAFVRVVECGSFTKAAAEAHVSANALVKQVNLFEAEVGVKLLERSHAGVVPTAAGKLLYARGLDIIAESRSALAEARAIGGRGPTAVRVGTSVFRPAKTTGRLWYTVAAEHPGIRLDLVKLPDQLSMMREAYQRLGSDIDVVVTITPSASVLPPGCRTQHLFDSPLCVAVPINHPLASRERLSVQDLYGMRVSMASPEASPDMEAFHRFLALEHPRVIRDIRPPYDLAEVNRCFAECELLLSCGEWDDVHPGMLNKPVEWGRRGNSIGISAIYALDASPAVREFVEAVARASRMEGAR